MLMLAQVDSITFLKYRGISYCDRSIIAKPITQFLEAKYRGNIYQKQKQCVLIKEKIICLKYRGISYIHSQAIF